MSNVSKEELLLALQGMQAAFDSMKELLGRLELKEQPTTPTPPLPLEQGLSAPGKFYDTLRASSVLGPKISPTEFAGCEVLLNACKGKNFGLSWTAYVLATGYHETAGTMQPVKEYGGDAYLTRMYDIQGARPDKARELGNINPGDGALFGGRGYPQVTGRNNYRRLGQAIGQPLEQQPDLLLEPAIAAEGTVYAMETGLFTGKSLSMLPKAPASKEEFTAARRIINGTDKAEMIADYAIIFQRALDNGMWS